MESKLPFLPIMFSAAHTSKWEAFPDVKDTQSVHKVERTVVSVDDQSQNDAGQDTCVPDTNPRECTVVAVATKGNSHENMAIKTYTWITLWFLLTVPVIVWDASYCFFRPRSMIGGDLHWIWEPYGIYQNIDYVYGTKALEENSGFPDAQSFLNVIETALNIVYVYLSYVSSWPGAPLVGFAAATMTLSKTVLYMAQEYFCGGCATGHNTWSDLLLYWVLPNGLWIVFPSMIVWRLGSDIVGSLVTASQSARRAASGKTQ